jgi:hypothetical protein
MVTDLQFCPRCGNAVLPGKKFCTNCGASLTPDVPAGTGTENSPVVVGKSPSPGFNGLFILAGVIVLIIVILLVGYPLLTGSGILSATGKPPTPSPTAAPAGGPGTHNGSWVEIITETMTPVTLLTTQLPVTTPVPVNTTLVPTSTMSNKPVVCASDRLKCNNTCIDPMNDNLHCGLCDTACPSGKFCSQGNCMKFCSSGETSCFDGCFNLQSHPDHCGSCTNNCEPGLICERGRCVAPLTPMLVPV